MTFSLIIGTLDRLDSIKICLESLFNQRYTDYEIIIIDQSSDNETGNYIKSLNCSKIIYRHVSFKGLSKARNEGLKIAKGDYFCLIDDDAYYYEDYLYEAFKHLEDRCVLSGYIYDTEKKGDFVKYNRIYNNRYVSLRMIMRLCPSAGLVIPFSLIHEVGFFDEQFGVGAKYGSGEETDLLLRGVCKQYKVKYIESMQLKHPVPERENLIFDENRKNEKRVKYYEGLGALYKKHIGEKGLSFLFILLLEVIVKFWIKILAYRCGKKSEFIQQFHGFLNGYRYYRS